MLILKKESLSENNKFLHARLLTPEYMPASLGKKAGGLLVVRHIRFASISMCPLIAIEDVPEFVISKMGVTLLPYPLHIDTHNIIALHA
jgi:hypothetical protein